MFQVWHKKFVKPLISILFFSIFLGCTPKADLSNLHSSEMKSTNTKITPEIRIGFCPTMTGATHGLQQKGFDFTEVPFASSSAAFSALYNGQVEAIIIGRSANASELSADLRLIRQQDGTTLISKQPGLILFDDLVKIVIHTAEKQSVAEALFPPSTRIVYYEDLKEALAMVNEGAILLSWSQMQPEDKLLIPVDSSGNKIQTFRTPHLYYKDSNSALLTALIENFTQ